MIAPALSACAAEIGSSPNRSAASRSSHWEIMALPFGYFPMRHFVEISHAEAALTNTRVSDWRMSANTLGEIRVGAAHHHSST